MNAAELLQIVWFTASQKNPVASETYRALIGEEPDGSQRNRTVNPADPILSSANGLLRNNVAELQIRPSRVDLIIRSEQASPNGEDPPTIDLQKTVSSLQKIIQRAPSALGPIVRVSMVSRLIERARTASDAAKEVLNRLGVKIEAPDILDTLFSVNSRIEISENLKINRIIRFEVLGLQTYAFDVQTGMQARFPVIKEQNYILLQLDINTVPLALAMTEDQHSQAFKAIVAQTRHLAEVALPIGLEK